ncbi:MAG TPA: DUF1800 family protein, partial [Candidatus Angelobacter sp.]|nr:DUF1800 family protein [Candidatus Angelobacter sp.]
SSLTAGAAARFLDHSSFGPNTASVNRVLQLDAIRPGFGMSDYIDEQMDPVKTPPSTWPDVPNPLPTGTPCPNNPMACLQQNWLRNALTGQDQLRQRTAFALSQITVISGITINRPDAYNPYIKMLNNDAFTTYDQVMRDVTLSPAMGWYLDMVNSAKAANGAIANENYARELMQLFSLGTELLNDDGTTKKDGAGNTIPTYDQPTIQAFARAFTGWTYKACCGNIQNFPMNSSQADFTSNMVPFDIDHDTGAKTLLNGQVVPAAQSAQQDLNAALANIFAHPNLPPFISKQLIQHLVTSNPSPAYVARISAVFKNNGSGVRGDLKAVIKAILLDTEARQGDNAAPVASFGHLREPVLFMTGTLRGLGFTVTDANLFGNALAGSGSTMGQNVLFSPSVFNYFPPDYTIPGTQVVGPEFAIQTTSTTLIRANWVDVVVRNGLVSQGISLDFSAFRGLPADQLTDQLGTKFMHAQMSAAMRSAIISTLSHLPASSDPDVQARTAIYLVLTSSQYQVIH